MGRPLGHITVHDEGRRRFSKLGLIADTDTGQIAMSDSEFVELVRMLHHYAT